MKCQICNQELKGKQTKFCSKQCKLTSTNYKNQNYESQQKRGIERKIKLIQSMGGKCEICNYNKNYAVLNFHHKNPEEKQMSLDLRNLSNNSWSKIEKEVKKCKLLCFNCHMELHHSNCIII